MSKSGKVRLITEWLVVAGMAVLMSRIGYMFLSRVTGRDWSDSNKTKWVLWSCAVSVVTWSMLWGWTWVFTRRRSLLPWLIMGAVSPLLGCFVFFPATPWALGALVTDFHYIIPFGIVTGLTIYVAVIISRRLTTPSSTSNSRA
jgi:hypothetical protein